MTVDLSASSATAINGFDRIDRLVGGSGTDDEIVGPGEGNVHIVWRITGANAGDVADIRFSGFENLTGQSGVASDAYIFESGGSLTGTVNGGTGTLDGFSVYDSVLSKYTVFNPGSGAADAGGTITIHGVTVNFAGMDNQSPVSGDDYSYDSRLGFQR